MIGFTLTKAILKNSFMPGFGTRLHNLFMSGFGYVPYFLAVVYQMVGLLPRNHAYLLQRNIGHFGVRHVVAEAARNLTFSWRHIDQIILFVAVLSGLVIFIVQFIAIGAMLFLQPVMAMPTNWAGFFSLNGVAYKEQDLAYMMLDMVFGVEHPSGVGGFFESCVGLAVLCQDQLSSNAATTIPATVGAGGALTTSGQLSPLEPNAYSAFPFPYHLGMHRLFAIYSNGLLVIAVMITSYFVATILAETAQSGTAFGRRFNKTWAPLRIVIAFGLLMPLGSGLNSSQYFVLYAAKYGSAFASNGWRYFNTALTTGYLGNGQALISIPNLPELDSITHFMYVARACKYASDIQTLRNMQRDDATKTSLTDEEQVQAYVLGKQAQIPENATALTGSFVLLYNGFLGYLDDDVRDVTVRFGRRDKIKHANFQGSVAPTCGEIQFKLIDPRDSGVAQQGLYEIQKAFYDTTIIHLWLDDGYYVTAGTPVESSAGNSRMREVVNRKLGIVDTSNIIELKTEYVISQKDEMRVDLYPKIQAAVAAQIASPAWNEGATKLTNKGWAGAGIWYNRIAEMNGAITASVFSPPTVMKYPYILEEVSRLKKERNSNTPAKNRFDVEVSNVDSLAHLFSTVDDNELAVALSSAYVQWQDAASVETSKPSTNAFIAAISEILGTDGLYNMRYNQTTHPLAMLSGIGRSLIESSIKSLGYAALSSAGGALGALPKQLAGISASFFISVAMMGITVGFVLFYVIPFLPFIYFFFAFGGWVKGIFEAMVGAPLWALAHIRIDGHGMPGNAAMNGYFLIFEVFLRPILIVFGLLASISIFSALVDVLNSIFTLVTENAAGYDITSEMAAPRLTFRFMRSAIDQFFYTVIYAIICYMIGMSAFKLIDSVPNNILRWMGQSVATFGDTREDPAQALVSRASMGSQQVSSKIGGGLQQAAGALNK